jgi:hypothetical protein
VNVVCVVIPHRFVSRYQYFGGTDCFHLQGWSSDQQMENVCFSQTLVSTPQVHTASPLGSPPPSEARSHVTTHSDRADIILTHTQGLSAGRGEESHLARVSSSGGIKLKGPLIKCESGLEFGRKHASLYRGRWRYPIVGAGKMTG